MHVEIEEYGTMLKIDKNDLDSAILEQSDIFFRVSEAYAASRDEMESLKDEVDKVDAELALMFRQEAEVKGEKTTEGKITSLVLVDERHHAATTAYREAKLRTERLGALKEAFNQRSSMLRELTNLYVSGYFTVSGVRGTVNKATDVRAATGREAMSKTRSPLKRQ